MQLILKISFSSCICMTCHKCTATRQEGRREKTEDGGGRRSSKERDNQVNFAMVFAFALLWLHCSQVKLPQVKQTSYVYGLPLGPHFARCPTPWQHSTSHGVSRLLSVSRGCHQDYLQVKFLLQHTCVCVWV